MLAELVNERISEDEFMDARTKYKTANLHSREEMHYCTYSKSNLEIFTTQHMGRTRSVTKYELN